MVTIDTSATLPKGVGQLPQWWLDNVLHDIRDDVLKLKRRISRRTLGLPNEQPQHELEAIEMEKNRLDSISTQSKAAGVSNPEVVEYDASMNGDDSILASLAASEAELLVEGETKGHGGFHITMTSEEEAAAVNKNRQKSASSLEYGQDLLRKRSGNIKTFDSFRIDEGEHQEEAPTSPGAKASPEKTIQEEDEDTTPSPVRSWSRKNSGTPTGKSYKTEFTGVSPFDFAMQQRAKQKERREKERLAKEALTRHHGHSQEANRAAQSKAKEKEERRKVKEAEENLKAFKTADLDKKHEVANDLKKLQIEEKQKKREAEEHLKGYRER